MPVLLICQVVDAARRMKDSKTIQDVPSFWSILREPFTYSGRIWAMRDLAVHRMAGGVFVYLAHSDCTQT